MIAELQNLSRTLYDTLFGHPDVEAAALYGSFARGDVEPHSDIDVLVFCRRSRKQPIYDSLLSQLSYLGRRLSLVIYSESEMRFLSSTKSLFLLHLSREANLLFDKGGYFEDLLIKFVPKESYREDFLNSVRLVDPLRTQVLGAPNQLHRLSYVYSLFRVFGVYLLAEKGIYEFSKEKMAQQLSVSFPHLADDVRLLSRLRSLNSNFFSGGARQIVGEASANIGNLAGTIDAIASMTEQSVAVRRVPYGEAIEEFAAATGQSRVVLDYRLRMWFLLLVYDGLNLYLCKRGPGQLTDLAEGSLLDLLDSSNPAGIRNAAKETIEYLHRYPLKYFLAERSKISSKDARSVLSELSSLTN